MRTAHVTYDRAGTTEITAGLKDLKVGTSPWQWWGGVGSVAVTMRAGSIPCVETWLVRLKLPQLAELPVPPPALAGGKGCPW